ncbi:MAG: hypothetical protein WC455_29540 [Dehalococcoidia bacterium]
MSALKKPARRKPVRRKPVTLRRSPVTRRRPRQYNCVSDYFHNYEHSPEGLTHCHSTGQYPYNVHHFNGHHVITAAVARGHGRGGHEQWFRFSKRLGDGYDLASGTKIESPMKR